MYQKLISQKFKIQIGPCRTVLYFNCPLETLENRLLERGKTSGRADDNIDTIKKRFKTFQDQSLAVIEYYKKKGKCVELSSEPPIAEVYQKARELFIPPAPLHLNNLIFVLGGILFCGLLLKRT
jgi:adenylate kinase family enzyme